MLRPKGAALLLAAGLVACSRGGAPAGATPAPATGPIDASRPLPEPLPRVAATVNGQPIPTARVALLARGKEQRTVEQPERPDAGALRRALQELIVRELLFQEALARGHAADPRQVERSFDAQRVKAGSEEEWRRSLEQDGLDPRSLREELRVRATIDALTSALARGHRPESISEEQARTYSLAHPEAATGPERLRLAQILVRVEPDLPRAERDRRREYARDLALRALAGGDFAALARAESQDEKTRDRGGELPELSADGFDPRMLEALAGLAPGGISRVVESGVGYHVFKLVERRPGERLTFEAAREQVRRHMVRAAVQREIDALVKALEARARIEVLL